MPLCTWPRVWLYALAFLVPGWGCSGHRAPRSPKDAVEQLSQALRQGRTGRAYALLSEAQRAATDFGDFQKQIQDNPTETKALSKAAGQVVAVRVEAHVELADGRTLRLTQERDGFHIDQAVADFYPRGTPREALLTFVRSIEAERWDVVLTLIPEADRGGLDARTLGQRFAEQREELTRLTALLSVSLDAPIEIVGDRATMPYGEGATMRFVRESDGWKVEEPE